MGPVAELIDTREAVSREGSAGLAEVTGVAGVKEEFGAVFRGTLEGDRVAFPPAVVLTRDQVFDLASSAHAVSFSLRGLGLDPQVAMLDRVVADLESCLVGERGHEGECGGAGEPRRRV